MLCPACSAENDEDATACFTCGQAFARPAATIQKGSLIANRYEIVGRLGKGGMGTVYKAHDKVLEEDVAIKILRDEIGYSDEAARRFRSEIRLARKVTNKNVCRIHEYGEDGGRHYISMELIEGMDLKHLIRQRGSLSPAEAFDIAIQVAQGLQAIHDVGIIHRDLKTPNLMLDKHGVVRLMDFGIAKKFEADATGMTKTGHIVGTPDYMSPEQARAQKVTFRSDIYALGIVVFELFTGDLPFRADTPVATILKHLNEPPPLDGAAASKIPTALLPVLARALAKDPSARYQTMAEMIEALREARSQTPGVPGSTPAPGVLLASVVPAPAPFTSTQSLATAVVTPVPTNVPTGTSPLPMPSVSVGAPPTPAAPAAAAAPAAVAGTAVRGIPLRWGMGAAVLLAAAGGIWMIRSPGAAPSTSPAAVAPSQQGAGVAAPARSLVRLNALPWAQIKLTPADPAAQVPTLSEDEWTTPCTIELADGEYFLELENGGLTPALMQKIRVQAGRRNDFVFTMPSYNPETALVRSGTPR